LEFWELFLVRLASSWVILGCTPSEVNSLSVHSKDRFLRLWEMKRFKPPLIVVVALALWITTPARAHANLVGSVPKAGEVVVQSPSEIILEFSESLDPAVSRVELHDVRGQVIVPGPGIIEPIEPRVLRLRLDTLPDGVYSAVWRARSIV
jgi:methionine-rich copper-binding protein CopC